MQIELLKPWGNLTTGGHMFPAGSVLNIDDGIGEMWIARGRAKRYVPPQPTEAEADAEAAPRRRRKQRTGADHGEDRTDDGSQ